MCVAAAPAATVSCYGDDTNSQISGMPPDLGPVTALAAGKSLTCAVAASDALRW